MRAFSPVRVLNPDRAYNQDSINLTSDGNSCGFRPRSLHFTNRINKRRKVLPIIAHLKTNFMIVLKRVVLCALLLAGSNLCIAQEISFRGGYNSSKISFKEGSEVIEGVKQNPGFSLGPFIAFPLNGKLSLETGMIFTSKGFKQTMPIISQIAWITAPNLAQELILKRCNWGQPMESGSKISRIMEF